MKFDTIVAQMQTEVFAVDPNYANSLLANYKAFRKGEPSNEKHTSISNDNVTYQVIGGNTAVIAIDGAMYKKSIGMCASVVSYDEIIKAIDTAESDSSVETILFRVDTRGGSVAGADEVRERIFTSPKKTVTFFENIGASGGMWIFTASDEVYASQATSLGSIGVIVMYQEPKEDEKVLAIVSSNAPNKYCDISDEKCKTKIQSKLNQFETMFLERLVEHYPEKTSDTIAKDFNMGDTIFADEAKEKGYLDDVTSFNDLLASMPTIRKNSKSASTKVEDKTIQGHETMELEELQAKLDKANATIEAKNMIVGELEGTVASLKKDIQEATATHETAIKDLTDSFSAKSDVMKEAVAMGMELGSSKETILEAMDKDTKDGAELAIRREAYSQGSTYQGGEKAIDEDELAKKKAEEKAAKLIAYAEETKIKG